MLVTGLLVIVIGLYLGFSRKPSGKLSCAAQPMRLVESSGHSRQWAPVLAGLLNGFVPCGLVFTVAISAAATADPVQAAGVMLAFGLGTLPALALISIGSAWLSCKAMGALNRLTALFVVLMGIWTFYQGWVYYDIIRGLAN